MEHKPRRSAFKNILYTFIVLFLLFLLVEVVLSIYLYHKHDSEKLATIEAMKMVKNMVKGRKSSVNTDNQKLVRPNASEEINKQIAEETNVSNKFEYEPWIEFKNIDYSGKFVNVAALQRKSIPEAYINPLSKDTMDIFFFGGSTTFGFNVADNETIPSQFVELYKEKFPSGKSVRVYNYGTPTYYSYQELMLFTKLLFEGKKPEVVIFLDGVNDFWFAKASYYNQSYFSYVMRQAFGQLGGGNFQFKDTAAKMYQDPENIPLSQYNNTLVEHYFTNIKNAAMMAQLAGAKSYFFCQPVPFYKYPNQQKDPICFKDKNTRYDYIYPLIEERAPQVTGLTFLGNMLQAETGYPFVDGLHYSPGFARKVAEKMVETVGEGLR